MQLRNNYENASEIERWNNALNELIEQLDLMKDKKNLIKDPSCII